MKMKRVLGVILVLLLAVSFLAACCSLCDLPADFRLTSVTVSPAAPVVNSTVTIRTTVTNVGETSSSCDVNLTIDGYTDSKSISLLAEGEIASVSFVYVATTEGSYTVTITTPDDIATRSFTVNSGHEESFEGDKGK